MSDFAKLQITTAHRMALIVAEAKRWTGVQEIGGNNVGQLVGLFQKAGQTGHGQPWCMAFAQYCIDQVDATAELLSGIALNRASMPEGAHCMTVWTRSDPVCRLSQPTPGAVVIWRHAETQAGHAGIVTEVMPLGRFRSIEGNTSPAAGINRDGDGVFEKEHGTTGQGTMQLMGFVLPWGRG